MMKEPNRLDRAEIEFFKEIQSLIVKTRTVKRASLKIRKICGVDAAYSPDGNSVAAAATQIVDGQISETSTYSGTFSFPYVSGLFYLHEGPFVVAAVRRLKETSHLVCFDAHGAAHPNSGGLATVCGRVLGIPSIGVAKTPLVGKEIFYRNGLNKIEFENRFVGYVTSKPKRYWSPGYSVSLAELETIICSKTGEDCAKALQYSHTSARRATRQNSSGQYQQFA